MKRYAIKQIWRSMKESKQGEFVRYEDVAQDNKINARLYNNLWNDYVNAKRENKQAQSLVENLEERVLVLFVISAVSIGCTVVRLILWSLGVL